MKVLLSFLLVLGLTLSTDGLYIQLKAELAQHLIAQSWAGSQHKPWPWADTWPVARLRYQDTDTYVLSGAHGSALAFGPGHVDGTALPGRPGTSVVAGHRDTHFRFLEGVSKDDELMFQTTDGEWHNYRVTEVDIVDTRQAEQLALSKDGRKLVLVTCYPFDAINPGGPWRFVVTAVPGSTSTPAPPFIE